MFLKSASKYVRVIPCAALRDKTLPVIPCALQHEMLLRRHGISPLRLRASPPDPVSAAHHCVLRSARDDSEVC